jgi:5-methylthioadenosine/S-adenosylhomocysteine deaminase
MHSNKIIIRGGVVWSMVSADEPRTADVFIDGSRIVAVGLDAQPFTQTDDPTVIDATGCVVMPGLINAHTHTPMTLMRSTLDGVGFPSPDAPSTMPRGQDWRGRLSPDDHYWASRLAIAEMIRSGTTTFVDMYRDMDQVARAVVETGMRAALGWEITTFRSDPHEWLPYDERTARRTFDQCGRFAAEWHGKGDGRITAWIAPHETSTCHEPWLSRAARLSSEMNLGTVMHVAESEREVEFCRTKYGLSPVQTIERAGILNRRVLGAHTLLVTDADIRTLSMAPYTAVACLGCYVKLAMPVTPVPRLLEAGVNVALGTDGAATNNNLSLWDEIYLNATIHGFLAKNPALLSGEGAIRLATVGGAVGLGLEEEIGTIEPKKRADIIVLDFGKPHLAPLEAALIGNLTYSAGGHDVRDVLVDGKVLMRDRRIVAFDEKEVLRQAHGIVRKHRAAVGLPLRYGRDLPAPVQSDKKGSPA